MTKIGVVNKYWNSLDVLKKASIFSGTGPFFENSGLCFLVVSIAKGVYQMLILSFMSIPKVLGAIFLLIF